MASRRLQLVLNLDTGGYSGKISRAGSQMQSFHGKVDSANRSIRTMDRRFDGLNRSMRAPLDKLRDYVLILSNMRLAFMNLRDLTVGWVGAMVKQSAEVERLTILMKGLSTETDDFNKSMEASINLQRLFTMARQNGFGVKEITDAFVKMKSGGVDPMNGSLNSLTDAVAAFGGTSDTMHRASIAIQQMAGKGVVSMEELRQQLGEAVPTAMKDMARAAGMSLKEFTDLVSKGKVQAKPALELMFREFQILYGGAGERIAQTVTGQMAALKTNAMELSTFFTGQAQQNNVAWKQYIAEQKELMESGLISADQFDLNTAGGESTFYNSLAEGMKELNEAMQSSEARIVMMELGQIVGDVAMAIYDAAKIVVEYRDEIAVIAKTIGAAFAMWTGYRVGQWMITVGKQWAQALSGMVNNFGKLNGKMSEWHSQMSRSGVYYEKLQAHQKKMVSGLVAEGSAATKAVYAARDRIGVLREMGATYSQNISILGNQIKQEKRAFEQAHLLYKAEVSQGRVRQSTAERLRVAKENLRKSEAALGNNRQRLKTTNTQLAASERQLQMAVDRQTAATKRAQAATVGLTTKQRLLASASRASAVAVRGLGMAMNVALGPIGMIAFALYQAASAAGFFESAADKATASVNRLMSGIASLEEMKNAQAQKDSLRAQREKLEKDKAASGKGYRYEGRNRVQVSRDTSKIDADIADLDARIAKVDQALQVGQIAVDNERGRNQANWIQAEREKSMKDARRKFRIMESEGASGEDLDKQRDYIEALGATFDGSVLEKLNSGLSAADAAGNESQARKIEALIDQYKSLNGITDETKLSTEELRSALLGAGKETGGLSSEQKKAQAAASRYQDMIARNAGEIAELTAQLEGGEGALAQFQARVDNGLYDDASQAQLDKMAKQFAEIDRLNKELDFKSSFGQLQKELAAANVEATQLWRSLSNGTWDKDLRRSQVESRFEEQISAANATGDPEKIAEVRQAIEETIEAINQIDAANIARDWQLATEDILESLMTEQQARQDAFEREKANKLALIELAGKDIDKRRQMQEVYDKWYAARQAKMVRDNESGVISMARDWAQLGQSMDRVATNAMDSIVDTLAEGKFAFGDIIKDVMKQIMKVILRAMIAYAILSAIGATNGQSFGGFMKGQLTQFAGGFAPQGGGGAAGNPLSAQTRSTGAIGNSTPISLMAPEPPKFHTGGWFGSGALKSGEVPLVGMSDEVALTADQQRFYGKAFDAAIAGNAPTIEINMINNSGTAVTADQSGTRMDGRKMIVDVVVDALNKEGPLRNSVEQLSGKG